MIKAEGWQRKGKPANTSRHYRCNCYCRYSTVGRPVLNVFIRTGGFRVVQYLAYHTDTGMTFQDGEPDVLQDLLGAAPLTVLAVRDELFV